MRDGQVWKKAFKHPENGCVYDRVCVCVWEPCMDVGYSKLEGEGEVQPVASGFQSQQKTKTA